MASSDSGGDDEQQLAGALESFPPEFASWEELEEFVGDFGANTFQVFRKRTSVTAALRNAAIEKRLAATARSGAKRQLAGAVPLIPEALRFYSKTYVCTHGLKNTPRGAGRRTHAAIRDTGCTARIHATLRYSAAKRTYVVTARVSGVHNHPVNRAQYFSYAENRRIADPVLLRDVAAMAARGETPRAILDYLTQRVHETTGGECVYKIKDIHNVLARLKSDPRALLGGQDAGTTEESGESDGASRTAADSAAVIVASMAAELGSEATHTLVVPGPVELHDAVRGDAAGVLGALAVSDPVATQKATHTSLARLEILLSSSYTYHSAHAYVDRLASVATELVENTVSRLKYEVVQMPFGHQYVDIDFVLPKHALAGCEMGISDFCHKHKQLPQTVGVRLPVSTPGAHGKHWSATLSSRQLLTMKKLYVAKSNVAVAKSAIEWVNDTNISAYPSPPFDEFRGYTKEMITDAITLMPLTKVMVCGSSARVRFTDSIYCSSLLKLSSNDNIDLQCVKAALLHMHARFYRTVGFVNPQFAFEADVGARCSVANAFGAFESSKEVVAGLSQLSSGRWSAFYYDREKEVCCLCAPTAQELAVAQQTVAALFSEFGLAPAFKTSQIPPASAAANDSGVLALLFVECMLLNATWGENPVDSFDYFRVRYLLHAIEVVQTQDVHEVART